MALTISAMNRNSGQLSPISTMASSQDARLENLGTNISNIDFFLEQFDRSDEQLINDVMRNIFEGISKAFENTYQEASQVNDCHFQGMVRVWSLIPKVEKLRSLYAMYDRAECLKSEFKNGVIHLQNLFQSHGNTNKGKRSISKCFATLHHNVKAAQDAEFIRYTAFQNDMECKRSWLKKIEQNTDLFPIPKSLDDVSCSSTFLKFCIELFSQRQNTDLTVSAAFSPEFLESCKIAADGKIENLQETLQKKVLPKKIEKLKDSKLFFHLLWKVAVREKIKIPAWDAHWAENNWKKHLNEYPHHILLALCAYESRQSNQVLKMIWENLLSKTSISVHEQWPTCARLLRTVKEKSIISLMQQAGSEIFECHLYIHKADQIVEELVIKNDIYNSICSIRDKIPRRCTIVSKLDTQLQMIGEALIEHHQPLTAEQKAKLESVHKIFLTLLQDFERYGVEDLNFLIEFIMDAFFFDFCSIPNPDIVLDQSLITEISSKILTSELAEFHFLTTSEAKLVFYGCSIQVASRIDLASSIGCSLKLPISKVKLINHTPLDIKKGLKKMIKEWSEKVKAATQSSEFGQLIQQLEELPSPFVVQIKDFIGRCISGNECDESNLGDEFLKKIPIYSLDGAQKKMKEVIDMIHDYSNGILFKETCTKYDESHPPLIGIIFPQFNLEQEVAANFDQRSRFPTSFKHLWALFNLITGNAETQSSCRLFLTESKSDSSPFQFIELSSYFSSSSNSRDDLALDVPFASPFLMALYTSKILEEAKAHLKFKIGLASDPLEKALERIEVIKTIIRNTLDTDSALTPNMLISEISMMTKHSGI